MGEMLVNFDGDLWVPINFSDWHPALRSKICICPPSGKIYGDYPTLTWKIYGWLGVCSSCSKPHWHMCKHCPNCDSWYIKVFDHPAYSPRTRWCWDCLESVCPDGIDEGHFSLNKIPPRIKPWKIDLTPVAVDFSKPPAPFNIKDH